MSETYVERTCTHLGGGVAALEAQGHDSSAEPRVLSDFRSEHAYVLLGDAGLGKTTEFRNERAQLGDSATYVSARDLVTLEIKPEWRDKTLFIDGLDEIRAGTADGRTSLDQIRNRLDQLGWPSYRISCREADWLGGNDRRSLESATPGGTVAVLRLDPLDHRAKHELVASHLEIDNTSAFFDEAAQRGLGGMLDNPLTLELLTGAFVHGGETWPESRRETFELACERMAREHNDEHVAAAGAIPPLEVVLAAVGRLAALQLLAGVEGFSLGPEDDDSPYVALDRIQLSPAESFDGDAHSLRHVLGTKLFSATPDSDAAVGWPRRTPFHRRIAEFLGGRYLARLVKRGLPARRVVALMTSPHDGRVVTSLRGLSAWFAAHSDEALDRLIDADPVGIGLYGDIAWLTGEQKIQLLRAIAEYATDGPLLGHEWRDGREVGYRELTAWAFRSIVENGTVEAIAELLRATPGDAPSDRIADFLLRVLAETEALSADAAEPLSTLALAVAREPIWSAQTRRAALGAFIRLESKRETRDDALAALLTDIAERRLTDPKDDLAGLTLRELYPHRVRPDEIWSYLEIRTRESYHGAFASFWNRAIVNQSSAHDAADALDALWANLRQEGLRFGIDEVLRRRAQDMMPVDLLVKALDELGDDVDVARLFGWLAAAAICGRDIRPHARQGLRDAVSSALEGLSAEETEQSGHLGGEGQAVTDRYADPAGPVRAWLEKRPETQRRLYLEWLKIRCGDSPIWNRAWFLGVPLFYSRLPRDLGRWCLEQALALKASNPELAVDILGHVVRQQLTDAEINEGLTLDSVSDATKSSPLLSAGLEGLLAASPLDGKRAAFEAEMRVLDRENRRKEHKHRQERADHIRDNLYALSDGSFPVHHLHDLAHVYFGHRRTDDPDTSGRERLREFLQGDERLAAAVMDALADVVFRAELPTVDETVSLAAESKHAWVAWPLFAGLHIGEHIDAESPGGSHVDACRQAGHTETQTAASRDASCQAVPLDSLSDERKRRVIATYLCVPHGLDRSPSWLTRWLTDDPELAEDVFVSCATGEVRAGSESSRALDELQPSGFDDSTQHRIRLRVLKSFPTAAPQRQLSLLDSLFFAVIASGRTEGVRDLVDAKLAAKSLTVAQRARWLAAAVFLFEDQYVDRLAEYAAGHPSGARCLADFLHNSLGLRWGRDTHFVARLELATLETFIEVLGGAFAPFDHFGAAYTVTAEIRAAEWVENLILVLSRSPDPAATSALHRLEQLSELAAWHDALRRAREDQSIERRNAEYRPPTVDEVHQTLRGGAPANAADLAALLLARLDDIADEFRGSSDDPWRPFWNEDAHGRPTEPKPENSCRDALKSLLQPRMPPDVEVVGEGSYAAGKRADLRVSRAGFNVPVEIKKNTSRDLWHAMRRQLMGQYTIDPATDGYGVYLVLWFGDEQMPTPASGLRPTAPDELRRQIEQELDIDETRKIAVRVIDLTKPGAA